EKEISLPEKRGVAGPDRALMLGSKWGSVAREIGLGCREQLRGQRNFPYCVDYLNRVHQGAPCPRLPESRGSQFTKPTGRMLWITLGCVLRQVLATHHILWLGRPSTPTCGSASHDAFPARKSSATLALAPAWSLNQAPQSESRPRVGGARTRLVREP